MSQMTRDVKVSREAFAKMCNLRIVNIYCDHIHNIGDNKVKMLLLQGLDSYPFEKLNYFHWDLYPLKSLPRNFTPENLIELVLRGSRVQKLWNHEVQSFPVLKRMDLSYSKLLTEIPSDLSLQAPNLESINLEGCTSLVQVLPSVQNLHKLTYLNLDGCSKLIEFKEIISRSRWYLDLIKSGGIMNFLSNICQQKLTFLKSFINNIWSLSSPATHMCQQFPMNLTVLRLSGTPVEEVPLSIGSLSGLVELDLRNCKQLKSLPTSIWNVKSLKSLYMSGCAKLGKLPEISEPMEHLTSLWLNEIGIEELPESIDKLISLKLFDLKRCKEIEFLPNKLCELNKLENLSLEGCSKLENLPNSLPPALYSLDVQFCESLKSIPDLPLSFGHLNARHCTSLEKIPDWKAALQPQLIHRSKHAEYFGCGKLDQNTRNTVLPDYAISEILNHGNLEDHFCYPGDEIPKWFSNQTNLGTTVLKIKLPPFWNNDNFLGLTLCVVLDLKRIKPWVDAFVKFELNFKTNDHECPQESFSKELFWANEECLDHVFMWHVPKVSFRRLKNLKWPSSCSGEASLHVCPTFYDNTIRRDVKLGSEYSEIKKWGVRFVNKEDVERFNAETIQNRRKRLGFDDECSEASGSGSGSDQIVPSGSHDELEDDDA